ncbi:unnamed protein product [Cochlearia groenlandica]
MKNGATRGTTSASENKLNQRGDRSVRGTQRCRGQCSGSYRRTCFWTRSDCSTDRSSSSSTSKHFFGTVVG